MKTFTSTDGTTWGVKVQSPSSSNAMIMFRHPDGRSSRLDRYNWVLTNGPESRSVTSRLDPDAVLDKLDEPAIRKLFLRSMPVSRRDPLNPGPEATQG